jgi:hypothetical protein
VHAWILSVLPGTPTLGTRGKVSGGRPARVT